MRDKAAKSTRVNWFHRARWGIFMHFLARESTRPMDVDLWNSEVDAFDVDTLAAQIAESGAGYFWLTLGQNSGWFCSPNTVLDKLSGRSPRESRCSRRDLIADMATALQSFHIPLLVYLPSHGPAADDQTMIHLNGIPPWDFHLWSPVRQLELARHADSDPRLKTFLRNWESVVAEWSQRWGKNVCGWWFDGCFYRERLYDFPDEPNFTSLANAARSGNPDSLFAVNPGVFRNPVSISGEEDYTSGENNRPEQSWCFSSHADDALYHILTYAGTDWSALPLRYSPQELADISSNIIDGGGVITWDVPYNRETGTLSDDVMELFVPLRRHLSLPHAKLSARFMLIRPPEICNDGTRNDGSAELELYNPARISLCGQLSMTDYPAEQVELSPGERRIWNVRVPATRTMFELELNGMHRFWHYPRTSFLRLVRSYAANPQYTAELPVLADGRTIARIAVARTSNSLLLRGTVFEHADATRVHPDYWRGSCIETFYSHNGKIIQRFFPARTDAASGWRLDNHVYLSAGETSWRMEPFATGYRFRLEFPTDEGEQLRFDVKVSVCTSGDFCRGTLFGSTNPDENDSGFGYCFEQLPSHK